MSKDKEYIRLIQSSEWVRLRRAKLSTNPVCERCAEEGRLTPATEVHHIMPVERGLTKAEKARLMFNPSNLRALCHKCHVRTHIEMGRSGKAANRTATEERLKRLKEIFFR